MNWTEEQLTDHYQRLIVNAQRFADSLENPARSQRDRQKQQSKQHGPNKWEQSYAEQELEPRRIVGEILWYGFEAIKLRLAGATYYTPDFGVVLANGRLEFREIKGFLREDAAIKFKVAAEQFPCFRFTMIRKRRVSDGGGWEVMRDLNVK